MFTDHSVLRDGDSLWTSGSEVCIPMNLSHGVLISRGRPAGGAASQPHTGALAARTLPSSGAPAPPSTQPRPASWRPMVSSQHEPRRLSLPFLPYSRFGSIPLLLSPWIHIPSLTEWRLCKFGLWLPITPPIARSRKTCGQLSLGIFLVSRIFKAERKNVTVFHSIASKNIVSVFWQRCGAEVEVICLVASPLTLPKASDTPPHCYCASYYLP